MTHVPASSHGGGLATTGGTLTGQLVIDAGAADPALIIRVPETITEALRVYDTTIAGETLAVDPYGNVISVAQGFFESSGGNEGLRVTGDGISRTATFRLGATIPLLVDKNGALVIRLHSAPADADLSAGECALWFDQTNGAAALGLKGKSANGTVLTSTHPLRQSSGALPTVAPVSGAAFQCSTTQDVLLTVPVTYNPGVATTATCKVELSPDNVTFSELVTVTQPVGTVFDGSIESVQLIVPAAWRVKLTVVNATLGTGTYY